MTKIQELLKKLPLELREAASDGDTKAIETIAETIDSVYGPGSSEMFFVLFDTLGNAELADYCHLYRREKGMLS